MAARYQYYVQLTQLIEEFGLEVVYAPENIEKFHVYRTEVNRPGLAIGGFFDYFDPERIQIFGRMEHTFFSQFTEDKRIARAEQFLSKQPVAIIFTREMDVPCELLEGAKRHKVPILRTSEGTSSILSSMIAYLQLSLAPRVIVHGVFVEVYGEGVLILGESGIGKSETAVELVKRGHRLVADDAVEVKRPSSKTLVGLSPANIMHYLEIRGIGIINVRRIFGMGAVKQIEKLDLVIKLEHWDNSKEYERLGMDYVKHNILGIEIPSLTIPVKPGRNLALIIEVAAMNNRQKKMGYNAAVELDEKLQSEMQAVLDEQLRDDYGKIDSH